MVASTFRYPGSVALRLSRRLCEPGSTLRISSNYKMRLQEDKNGSASVNANPRIGCCGNEMITYGTRNLRLQQRAMATCSQNTALKRSLFWRLKCGGGGGGQTRSFAPRKHHGWLVGRPPPVKAIPDASFRPALQHRNHLGRISTRRRGQDFIKKSGFLVNQWD